MARKSWFSAHINSTQDGGKLGLFSVVQVAEKWIQKAIKKPGALRKSLGAKAGKNIPKGKLQAAAKKKGVTGRRARLAQTLKKLGKK